MCCSLLASQQSKKSPFRFSPLSTSAVHFIFPTIILPKTPNNHRHQASFLFIPHKTTQTQRHPHGPEGWGCSWPTRWLTQRSLQQRLHHDQIPAPSTLSFSLSLSLSLITLFFNKSSGICVILGSDFEIRGRIMS